MIYLFKMKSQQVEHSPSIIHRVIGYNDTAIRQAIRDAVGLGECLCTTREAKGRNQCIVLFRPTDCVICVAVP